MPSEETERACAIANRDGFGLCTPSEFYKSVSFLRFKPHLDNVRREEPCIMHFRLATNGSVRGSNCHPFKRGDVYFAHNGVLPIEPYCDKTDSETAFIKLLYPAIEKYGMNSIQLKSAVGQIIGKSKFAFMENGNVRLFGEFFNVTGCLFSNLRYKYWLCC